MRLLDVVRSAVRKVTDLAGALSAEFSETAGPRSLSRLQRLVATRRRTTYTTLALLAIALVTVFLDIALGSDSPDRPYTLVLALVYGTYASLLASLLTSRTVVAAQISSQRESEHIALGILGLTEEMARQEVAIVLPAFPVLGTEMDRRDEAVRVRERLQEELGFPPSPTVLKTSSDIGQYAYARRDVLLATDIVRIAGAAGLPQPFIVSDIVFGNALRDARTNDGVVRVPTGPDDPGSLRRIRGAVLVGLWSNLTTCQISDHEAFPFQMVQEGDPPVRHLDLVTPHIGITGASPPEDADDGDRVTYGLLGRFHLPDFTLSVLGGNRSFGTARMGDLLADHPAECRVLWEVPPDEDLWAVVACPNRDDRNGGFEVFSYHRGKGVVAGRLQRLADLVADVVDLTDAREADDRSPTP